MTWRVKGELGCDCFHLAHSAGGTLTPEGSPVSMWRTRLVPPTSVSWRSSTSELVNNGRRLHWSVFSGKCCQNQSSPSLAFRPRILSFKKFHPMSPSKLGRAYLGKSK